MIGTISSRWNPDIRDHLYFSVPFDKETVKYVLHSHRLSTGCRSSTNGSRITRGLRGDVHSSWFTRSTRRAVCIGRSGRPRRCVTILDRNVTQWNRESPRNQKWKPKVLLYLLYYNAKRNILACNNCPNVFFFYSRRWYDNNDCKLDNSDLRQMNNIYVLLVNFYLGNFELGLPHLIFLLSDSFRSNDNFSRVSFSEPSRENVGVQIIQMINELTRNGMMKGTFRAVGALEFCLNARADVAERLTPRLTNARWENETRRARQRERSRVHDTRARLMNQVVLAREK